MTATVDSQLDQPQSGYSYRLESEWEAESATDGRSSTTTAPSTTAPSSSLSSTTEAETQSTASDPDGS